MAPSGFFAAAASALACIVAWRACKAAAPCSEIGASRLAALRAQPVASAMQTTAAAIIASAGTGASRSRRGASAVS